MGKVFPNVEHMFKPDKHNGSSIKEGIEVRGAEPQPPSSPRVTGGGLAIIGLVGFRGSAVLGCRTLRATYRRSAIAEDHCATGGEIPNP